MNTFNPVRKKMKAADKKEGKRDQDRTAALQIKSEGKIVNLITFCSFWNT
jgi:hypothetical protein